MIEAKDTVMPLPQILDSIKYKDGEVGVSKFERLALAQAETTWPIAENAGMQKVVEWIKTYRRTTETELYIGYATYTHYDIRDEQLQAQLEKWYIKPLR